MLCPCARFLRWKKKTVQNTLLAPISQNLLLKRKVTIFIHVYQLVRFLKTSITS